MPSPATLTVEHLIELAKGTCQELELSWTPAVELLLSFGFGPPSILPKKGGKELLPTSTEQEVQAYLRKYLSGYFAERERRVAFKQVSTKPDPAVDEVLKSFEQIPSESLSDIAKLHRLSMAAENLIGTLLERYIAEQLEAKGWVWACGETLRAIDFLKPGNPPIPLQIKNRSNSENSSSAAIRQGTDIRKWYRINANTGQTYWEKLQYDTGVVLSEEDFHAFIRRTALQI